MPIAGTTQPDLMSGNMENGWLAQHSRSVDSPDPNMPIIEMGARPCLPSVARFVSVDPVEGGNASDYTYPTDPINQWDLTGRDPRAAIHSSCAEYDEGRGSACERVLLGGGTCPGGSYLALVGNAAVCTDFVPGALAEGSWVLCFQQLACGLATGTMAVFSIAATGVACGPGEFILPVVGCAAVAGFTGGVTNAVKNVTLNRISSSTACAFVSGAISSGAGQVAGYGKSGVANGAAKMVTSGAVGGKMQCLSS